MREMPRFDSREYRQRYRGIVIEHGDARGFLSQFLRKE